VPREFLDHYPLDKVPMPKTYAVPGTEHHPWVKAQAEFIGQDKHFKDDEERRRAYASYLGLLSFVDAQVGFILDMLTQTGLAENTHVLYTSDHGDSPGARGLWGKFNFYEESAKVPMILSGPDVPDGVVCETPVSLIDCHATILDGLGVERASDDPRREAAHSSRLPIQTTHPTDRSSVNITPSPRRRAATCCVKAHTSITTTSATGRNCSILRPTPKNCRPSRKTPPTSLFLRKWSKASANVSIPKPSMLKRKRRIRHDTCAGLCSEVSLFSVRCPARSLQAG
ncbi:MAG: sulfatase-like hydrolase/transferase, partial [Pseudomonadota bacterium]|nr:sulfatase-like hydrolase/transferase [Pseudomonadota bacterium]